MMIVFKLISKNGLVYTYKYIGIFSGSFKINIMTNEIIYLDVMDDFFKVDLEQAIKLKLINDNYPEQTIYATA